MAFKYKGLRLKDPSLMKKLRQVPLTFTRASVAYDYKGDAVGVNTPRFQHLINGKMEYGCLIEEAHTNILPASQSQSLSEAYTTAALNGTYTFQCEGTGSYTLSGGATGTVSKDNPVTAAISSATVTLTPTGTSTLNQILLKAYPLSYTLGGTTQAAETLLIPASVLNSDNITIEFEYYPPIGWNERKDYNYLYKKSTGLNRYMLLKYVTSGVLFIESRDDAGASSLINLGSSLPSGWNKLSNTSSLAELKFFKNGVQEGSTLSNPKLPATHSNLYIGSNETGTQQSNGIHKNFTVSKIPRGDTDVTARATRQGFGVDRQVSLIAPLTRDLKAYRVRT